MKTINFENTLLVITSDHGDYLLSENATKINTSSIKSKIRSKIPSSTYDYLSTIKRGGGYIRVMIFLGIKSIAKILAEVQLVTLELVFL